MRYDESCRRCPLSDRPRDAGLRVCVPASGPAPCGIAFYGEAPGAVEEQQARPFAGDAGKEFDALLKTAGLRRRDVFVSNPVRCRPPSNRAPTKDEVAACMAYTLQELSEVKPRVIVALGVSAIKALTGKGAVGENRGKLLRLLPDYRSTTPVVPTYHPAAYLHTPQNRAAYTKVIVEDIRLARKVAEGSTAIAPVVTPYDGERPLRKALHALSGAKLLACDLEWEVIPEKKGKAGKSPSGKWPWSRRDGRTPRVVSIALAGRVDGRMICAAVPLDGSVWERRVRRIVASVPTFYHNAGADLIWLYSMGWKVRLADDTFLLASLLNLDTSLSLKALASTLTDMPAGWEREAEIGRMPTTEDEWRRTLEYNGNDAVATVLLRTTLRRMVRDQKRPKVLRLYRHVLLPAVQILARTALNGVPIDEEMLARLDARLDKRRRKLEQRIGDSFGLPEGQYGEVLRSNDRLAPYLERATKVELPRTASGRPSITKDILLQLRGKHPAVGALSADKRLRKRSEAYYRPWRWLLVSQGDRRLHSVYRLTVARTGRSSAEGELGNTFQQFPREKKARQMVEADEGRLILSVDQGQIELRIAAFLAQEKKMLGMFRRGEDLHMRLAVAINVERAGRDAAIVARILKEPGAVGQYPDWVELRARAKNTGFGYLYGMGAAKFVRQSRQSGLEFTIDEAEAARDAFFQFYPALLPWHDSCWRFVEQGYVDDELFGRRRMLPFSDGEDAEGRHRKAINTPVQGPASDLALLCMDYTWELLRAEYGKHAHRVAENIGFFHDAMQLHIDEGERDAIEQIVKRSWEHPPLERLKIEFDVPLEAKIEIGKRWS